MKFKNLFEADNVHPITHELLISHGLDRHGMLNGMRNYSGLVEDPDSLHRDLLSLGWKTRTKNKYAASYRHSEFVGALHVSRDGAVFNDSDT